MYLLEHFFYFKYLISINLSIIFFFTTVSILLFYIAKYFDFQFLIKNLSIFVYLRFLLITVNLISFFLFIYLFIYYIYINKILIVEGLLSDLLFNFTGCLNIWLGSFYFSLDFFSFILLFLAYIVGFISLLALDTRLYWRNIKYIFSFNIFILIVFFYVATTNLILFFLFYEFLLIPSFLFVYFVSYSRKAIQASLYFVIWTQIGSFLVLCAVAYLIAVSNFYDFFSVRTFVFTNLEIAILYTLLFFGFGFKVPIWPFHYWLTKTHVEAPSGFSIYLSGFLVKSALFGFYRLTNVLGGELDTTIFSTIAAIGVIDSSLKMWGQVDVKKLVAYGTIQEMNLIYLVFCWGDSTAILGAILFCATHAFLSVLMFYLVDCIYRRYLSRHVTEVSGILHVTPNLGISILFMTIFYAGIPGTIKFISEFYIFSGLLEVSSTFCFLLMFIANVCGLIGFSKCWFNCVFGMNISFFKKAVLDLSKKELLIIVFSFFFLFFFSFFIGYFF